MRASAGSTISSASRRLCCSHVRGLIGSSGTRAGRVCFRRGSSVPYRWPALLLPGLAMSWNVPIRRASDPDDDESHVRRIVDVVAAPELARPALGRLEQIGQRRHRPVVQIRRAQPQAVERNRDVTVRSSGMPRTSSRAPRRRRCSAFGIVRRPRVEAMAIGADLRDRYHRAGAGAAERVARGARAVEDRLALLRRRLVDRERILAAARR